MMLKRTRIAKDAHSDGQMVDTEQGFHNHKENKKTPERRIVGEDTMVLPNKGSHHYQCTVNINDKGNNCEQ